MGEENIDGAVKWLMKRLMETSTESFELAFARYETSEREAALVQARRLMDSEDPAERELGERLKAEVMKEHRNTTELNHEVSGGNGAAHDPLSHSPLLSLPVADSPLPVEKEETANHTGNPPKLPPKQNHRPQPSPPTKRGPGRPRKS